jgi:hypothetical protein
MSRRREAGLLPKPGLRSKRHPPANPAALGRGEDRNSAHKNRDVEAGRSSSIRKFLIFFSFILTGIGGLNDVSEGVIPAGLVFDK